MADTESKQTMIGRQEQILQHEVVSVASGAIIGTTFTSKLFPYGQEPGFVVITRLGAAVTGTTAGLVVALQGSKDGGAFATIGSAGASLATVTSQALLVTLAQITTAFGTYVSTSTYVLKVLVTAGNADNICTDVTIDVLALT